MHLEKDIKIPLKYPLEKLYWKKNGNNTPLTWKAKTYQVLLADFVGLPAGLQIRDQGPLHSISMMSIMNKEHFMRSNANNQFVDFRRSI